MENTMKIKLIIIFTFILGLTLIANADEPERIAFSIGKQIHTEEDPFILDGGHYTTVSIMDCHNVIIRNADITGGINLNDSYPEIGLKNITIENCYIHDTGSARPIFSGGSNIDGIFILNNKIGRTYNSTHGIYLSGGQWKGEYPPIRNIVIKGNTIGIGPAGRNGIQCNGRFYGGEISDNLIFCFELNGINLIGCQNFTISNNTIFGNNRGCIGIYNYIDTHYWNPFDEDEMKDWLASHYVNNFIKIIDNKLIVGPKQFHKGKWHNNDPRNGYPVIFLKDASASDVDKTLYYLRKDPEAFKAFLIEHGQDVEKPEEYEKYIAKYIEGLKKKFEMPTGFVGMVNNKIWTPNTCIVQASSVTDVDNLYFMNNEIWVEDGKQPYADYMKYIADISGNKIKEPEFDLPIYPFVDITKTPDYKWTEFTVEFKEVHEYENGN
jgi:hypothetical protein